MAIITIPQNFGPSAGEISASYNLRSVQYSDASIVTGHAVMDLNMSVLDVDLANAFHEYMVCEDECDYDATVDGTTNIGLSTGYM